MTAPATPPASSPATPPLVVPPQLPNASQTKDDSQINISQMAMFLQRALYEANKDLFRANIEFPLDLNIAPFLCCFLPGSSAAVPFGVIPPTGGNILPGLAGNAGWPPDYAGKWIIENVTLTMESTSDALTDIEMRMAQNVAALGVQARQQPEPAAAETQVHTPVAIASRA